MHNTLSEFKFYQSFRISVESKDDLRFLVEREIDNKMQYLEDARLVDISMTGLGFSTKDRISVGKGLRISLQFKKYHLDITGTIVRAFTSPGHKDEIIYGVEVDEEEVILVKKFLENYINSFSPERLKDCLVQSALMDKYTNATQGFEMFSLMLSLYKDMTNFGNKEEFVTNMLDEVTRVMNAGRATIFLINPNTNELEAVAALGVEKSLLKFDYRKGIAGSVFTTGVSLNIDARNDKVRFSEEIDKVTGFVTKSIICCPLYNREDKVIGVIEILNKRNEDRFSVEDEKTMKLISLIFSSVYYNYNPISEKSLIRRFSTPRDREYALIGKHPIIQELRQSLIKIKDLETPLLLCGESGVGKSLIARILHNEGKRGLQSFEVIDCGTDQTNLEQMLFGKDGTLEKCIGGTVFIREICHMPLTTQAKFLETIKNKRVSGSTVQLDFRLITSSSVDLSEMVTEGVFNKELFEIVQTSIMDVPSIRKRKSDLPELINYFLGRECKKQGLLLKTFSANIMDEFIGHDWPGNVAELKKSIEKAVLYNPKAHIINNIASNIIPVINKNASGVKSLADIPHANDSNLPLKDRVALIEREMIFAEIKKYNGNKSKAAKAMGMSREALRKKLLSSDEVIAQIENPTPLKIAA